METQKSYHQIRNEKKLKTANISHIRDKVLISAWEASYMYSLSEAAINYYRSIGEISFVAVSRRRFLYSHESIKAFIAKRTFSPDPIF